MPELPDCRRDLPPPELPASAAVQLPEYTRRSSRKASAAVQLPEYTAGAAGLPPSKLRRQSGGGAVGGRLVGHARCRYQDGRQAGEESETGEQTGRQGLDNRRVVRQARVRTGRISVGETVLELPESSVSNEGQSGRD